MDEDDVVAALAHPGVMIASDGGDLSSGIGHPRGAGTHARILGRYVREQNALGLAGAIAKMTLLPAQRMEAAVPEMKDRGRIRVGATSDITIVDPVAVVDQATFDDPAEMSTGIPHVLVGRTFVVRDSELVEGATPGQAIRRVIG